MIIYAFGGSLREGSLLKGVWFFCVALATTSVPRTSVSENTNNKDIHWKHDEGALNSNHELLPGKLKMTWKQSKREMKETECALRSFVVIQYISISF